jgi:hypothetical protein
MPIGFAAVIMRLESHGEMDAPGDMSLGEVGYFQVTKHFPPKVGLPPASRYDPETNFFLGLLEYQMEAAELHYRFPHLVKLGTVDSWLLSRTAFAIGTYGTIRLIELANPRPGYVYDDVIAYLDRTGGIPLGTQSAGKIWYRVHLSKLTWDMGQATLRGRPGWPTRIPAPPGVSYTIPTKLEPLFEEPVRRRRMPVPVFAGLALAGGLGLAYWLATHVEPTWRGHSLLGRHSRVLEPTHEHYRRGRPLRRRR